MYPCVSFRPADLPTQIGKGFERLYETIDDLCVDVPAARGMAAKFTARAVVDEVLPPGFLMDPIVTQLAGDIADQAKVRRRSSRTSPELIVECSLERAHSLLMVQNLPLFASSLPPCLIAVAAVHAPGV